MQKSPAAKYLDKVYQTRPFAFSDFYRRGRPVRREPSPTPPQISFLILQNCSLGCRFCFAGSALRRGGEVSFERLRPVFETFSGTPKAVILGGEPFEHSEINQILTEATKHFTDEVEVYTNGSRLPDGVEALETYLAQFESMVALASITLTLALDQSHAERLGKDALEVRICQFLDLYRATGRKVRFNVTDEAFLPAEYLARTTVQDVLKSFSIELAEFFSGLETPQEIEDHFIFNPVQSQGRQLNRDTPALALRLADAARGGDLVCGLNLTDPPGEERLALFNSLNSAWACPPPSYSVIGHLDEPLAKSTLDLCTAVYSEQARIFSETSQQKPSSIAEECLAAMQTIHDDPAKGWCGLADKLFNVARDPGELVFEAGLWAEDISLPFPVQHGLVERLLKTGSDSLQKTLDRFVDDRLQELGQNDEPWAPAFKTPWLDGLARIPADTPQMVPLSQVAIETGLGLWPGQSSHPVRVELSIKQGPRWSWSCPGITASPFKSANPELLRRWISIWRLITGETFWSQVKDLLEQRILAAFPSESDARDIVLKGIRSELQPANDFFSKAEGDPMTLFRLFAFDTRRGAMAWDDAELLEKLLKEKWQNWEPDSVMEFKEALTAALERIDRSNA